MVRHQPAQCSQYHLERREIFLLCIVEETPKWHINVPEDPIKYAETNVRRFARIPLHSSHVAHKGLFEVIFKGLHNIFTLYSGILCK